jgi:hypothetical protein
MHTASSSLAVLAALLVALSAVACGDGDSVPEGRGQQSVTARPTQTFGAPLPSDPPAAVGAAAPDDSAADAEPEQDAEIPPNEPVTVAGTLPEQTKSE